MLIHIFLREQREAYVILGQNTFIGRYMRIGDKTKCHYKAKIFKGAIIGKNCRIGGLCCIDCDNRG